MGGIVVGVVLVGVVDLLGDGDEDDNGVDDVVDDDVDIPPPGRRMMLVSAPMPIRRRPVVLEVGAAGSLRRQPTRRGSHPLVWSGYWPRWRGRSYSPDDPVS